MRWQHPERDLIPPDTFMPMAEDSGLIVGARRCAIREVCQMINRLDQARPDLQDLYVSINLSATYFDDKNFLDNLYDTLEENSTPDHRVHIEITERLLLKQPKNMKETLDNCRARGIEVIIEDFGTGNSSLSYLHHYPIDPLKIDQSFIHKMSEDPIVFGLVKSILSLSQNMDIKMIAEGVEDIEEASVLSEWECDMAQGYFYSRDVPELQVLELLLRHNGPLSPSH